MDKSATKRPVFVIHGSPEWLEWLGRLAEHVRLSRSDLVDQSLARLARELDFQSPPPRS